MKTTIIFNPSSGRQRAETTALAVRGYLATRGLDVEMRPTHGPCHATSIAAESAPASQVIVAVGGDGTINEVVTGMAQAADAAVLSGRARPECRLGIVPAGTVNVLALELGLPFRLEQACDVIAAGKSLSLDLGKVNGRRFILMLGVGIDALTVRNVDLRTKRRLRELAFVGTGLVKGLVRPPRQFSVTVDGTTHLATFFVAGNCRYYAHRLTLTPHADPTDGQLDLMLFGGTTRSGMLAFWMGVPSRLHLRTRRVTQLRARRVELAPLDDDEPIWFQTDGELAGKLPATVDLEPHALQVLVP